jgi:DNA-binding NarL/FixJ family response regulator
MVETALRRGAAAYIVKSIDPSDLASTLRQAIDGNVFSAYGVGDASDSSSAKAAGLTDREISILKALAKGSSNEQIAKEFWVAQQTVKFHLTNIYRKLGVKNRTEAIRHAYKLGFVESPIFEDE